MTFFGSFSFFLPVGIVFFLFLFLLSFVNFALSFVFSCLSSLLLLFFLEMVIAVVCLMGYFYSIPESFFFLSALSFSSLF